MWKAPIDPGVLAVTRVMHDTKRIRFANIFAANDPESTLMNIRQLENQQLVGRPLTMVINCRPDRIERNGQMGELSAQVQPESIVLIGEVTRSAGKSVPPELQDRVADLGGKLPPGRLLEGVMTATPDGSSIIAVGNIHGQGEVLLHELAALPGWTDHDSESGSTPRTPPGETMR
jgi:hypothetical protein